MKYINAKTLALIVCMSALGNVLGFLGIRLPSAPGTTVEFHLSALPALLVTVSINPVAGAITGLLSVIISTMRIGNVFIPFGNALLAAIAGLLHGRFKLSPSVCGALAVIPYAPYIWLACTVYGVPSPVISFIIVKALIELSLSGIIVELVLSRREIKNFFSSFRT
ncbi:MAG: hypothetical protein N3F10_06095 [Candidatus Bathyarchaeota archaeon]|nr:hypothetical protein [Candidatus Bathyarchaeota archaeon]